MQSFKRVLLDLGLLGLLSIAIGFGANGIRERGAIKPTKNYFEKTTLTPSRLKGEVPPVSPNSPSSKQANLQTNEVIPAAKTENTKHIQHDYQEIDFAELVKVFHDPATAQGLNLFVDARKSDLYEEGHIPGAVHCELGDAIDDVIARANGVERVIVYCSGGDCEDSIFMCRELLDAAVPYDSIFLYPGGWKEWSANQMPTQAGREEQ